MCKNVLPVVTHTEYFKNLNVIDIFHTKNILIFILNLLLKFNEYLLNKWLYYLLEKVKVYDKVEYYAL